MNYLNLSRDFDRIFDGFGGQSQWAPACEIDETEGHYILNLEVPGIPQDQLKVEVRDQKLIISGERKDEFKESNSNRVYTERRSGRFERSFELPQGVAVDQIEAHNHNGILSLSVPKSEGVKPRQIKVSTGAASGFFGRLLGQKSANGSAPEKVA